MTDSAITSPTPVCDTAQQASQFAKLTRGSDLLRLLLCFFVALLPCQHAIACALPGLRAADVPELKPPIAADTLQDFSMPLLLPFPGKHAGRTYRATNGTTAKAPEAGVVVFAGQLGQFGNVVQIAHGSGYQTLYANLSSNSVNEGQCINKGDIIGRTGCTGLCGSPQLYFEVSLFGEPLDPAKYVQKATTPGPTSPSDWRSVDPAELLDGVAATVEAIFLDKALLAKVGWKQRVIARRYTIQHARSPEEAVGLINGLLDELETSHTKLYTPNDYEYFIIPDINGAPKPTPFSGNSSEIPAQLPGIGVFTRRLDGRYFIDGVLEGSAADKAGLKFGDELISVDAAPYSPVDAFRDKVGRTVDIQFRRRAEGASSSIRVFVEATNPASIFDAATKASAKVIEQSGSRIGYIHIWAFNSARAFEDALDTITSHDKPNGARLDCLIVDARAKVGGSSTVVEQILEKIEGREPYWGSHDNWKSATWHSAITGNATGPKSETGSSLQSFRGRSALLIDRHTRSAGEIMAYAYKRSKFGTVIGGRTAAAVVSGNTYIMPGGLLLYLAVVGHAFNGRPIEGEGVYPDVQIDRSLPYADGSDPALAKAISTLLSQRPG